MERLASFGTWRAFTLTTPLVSWKRYCLLIHKPGHSGARSGHGEPSEHHLSHRDVGRDERWMMPIASARAHALPHLGIEQVGGHREKQTSEGGEASQAYEAILLFLSRRRATTCLVKN
jgi:hypothetical protein